MNTSRPRRERGIALLIALLGLAVLSVIALGLVLQTRAGVSESTEDLRASHARAFSDAVILQTVILLLSPNQAERPRIDGVPQLIDVLGQKIPVTVTSEFGKVDLNTTDQTTLSRLFLAAGLGPDEANEEADDVMQWRHAGHLFRETAELANIPGITPSLYATIVPAITVYAARGQIDLSTAPLLALEAAGEDRQTAEAAIRDRDAGQSSGQLSDVSNGKLIQGIDIIGWAFHIDADFALDGRDEHVSAVIRMTGDPDYPYYTLWREELPE